MKPKDQIQQIGNSLKIITAIFKTCNADYRILGSILLVAHTGKIFRHINDVDILLDVRAKNCVFKELENYGFKLEKKTKMGFSWFEAKKDKYLDLTFLLVGEFSKSYFSWRFMKFFELQIRADYLRPTEYNFETVKFTGVPFSSVVVGIRQASLNPKRKLDKEILGDEAIKSKVKTLNNISVYIAGIKLPLLYDLFSFTYNIYGGIRIMFGRKYEIWD